MKLQGTVLLSALIFMLAVLAIPRTPDSILSVLDHPALRLTAIILLISAVAYSPVFGIAAILIVGLAFIEHNSRKNSSITPEVASSAATTAVSSAVEVVSSAATNAIEAVTGTVAAFTPQSDTGSNEFIAVGAGNLNQKFVPKSAPLGSAIAAAVNF